MQANDPRNSDTGEFIYLGGSQRGDSAKSKALITGQNTPDNYNPAGLLVDGSNNVGVGYNLFYNLGARLDVNGDIN